MSTTNSFNLDYATREYTMKAIREGDKSKPFKSL
jgi:hypothetical protein